MLTNQGNPQRRGLGPSPGMNPMGQQQGKLNPGQQMGGMNSRMMGGAGKFNPPQRSFGVGGGPSRMGGGMVPPGMLGPMGPKPMPPMMPQPTTPLPPMEQPFNPAPPQEAPYAPPPPVPMQATPPNQPMPGGLGPGAGMMQKKLPWMNQGGQNPLFGGAQTNY